MAEALPKVYLARHGQTAWSLSGQHTGRTDIPLTPEGEQNARRLGERLAKIKDPFQLVLASPVQRARRTADLAGFGNRAQIDPDLYEWDYGQYEGRTTDEIRRQRPDWQLFRNGVPGGETLAQVAAGRPRHRSWRAAAGNVLIFSSGHILRVLAALVQLRWFRGGASQSQHGFVERAKLRTQPAGARAAVVE